MAFLNWKHHFSGKRGGGGGPWVGGSCCMDGFKPLICFALASHLFWEGDEAADMHFSMSECFMVQSHWPP